MLCKVITANSTNSSSYSILYTIYNNNNKKNKIYNTNNSKKKQNNSNNIVIGNKVHLRFKYNK